MSPLRSNRKNFSPQLSQLVQYSGPNSSNHAPLTPASRLVPSKPRASAGKDQLFLFTHVMQQATGIVVKPYHEIKIIHVQACVTVQESDILDDLIQLFEMLPKIVADTFSCQGSPPAVGYYPVSVPVCPLRLWSPCIFHAGKRRSRLPDMDTLNSRMVSICLSSPYRFVLMWDASP